MINWQNFAITLAANGRPRTTAPKAEPAATVTKHRSPSTPPPEVRVPMSSAKAMEIIGTLPATFSPYCRRMSPEDRTGGRAMLAARSLYLLGLAVLAQRRDRDGAIVYLIKRASLVRPRLIG